MPRLSDRIDQGRGLVPADLVLKGGRVFDLITGDLVETDVAICGDTIVGVFGDYEGRREIDCRARCWCRASSTRICISKARWSRRMSSTAASTPRGVTTAICDPHEIANVCGVEGIRYFLEASAQHGDGHPGAAVVLRALDPHGDGGRAAGGGRPCRR